MLVLLYYVGLILGILGLILLIGCLTLGKELPNNTKVYILLSSGGSISTSILLYFLGVYIEYNNNK
jgi:hypothetical protein